MATIRQKRNDPCHCKSGKKAKKCCLLASQRNDLERKEYFDSPVAEATNEIAAAIGGSFGFEPADEPAMGPPRWLTWGLLAFAAVQVAAIICLILISKG